jgi:tetratricopeptide (TPR) repeat protein
VAIADADFELGNYERASRRLADLVRVLPEGPGVESRLAKQAAVEGRLDDAIRASADAVVTASELDLRPSEAAFYRFQLGHFLAQAGRIDEALAALDAGLAIDPDHLASLEAKAAVLVSLDRLEEAAALYEQLIERGPAADLYGELAKLYRVLGRDAAADEAIATGILLGHEQLVSFPAERRHLASFFAEFEPETALEAASADFATRKDVGAYDTLAWAYFQNGQPEAAARYVDRALAQGTRDAQLLYHAGIIEAAVGHSDRAVGLLRDALALNPRFDLVQAPKAAATLRDLTASAT